MYSPTCTQLASGYSAPPRACRTRTAVGSSHPAGIPGALKTQNSLGATGIGRVLASSRALAVPPEANSTVLAGEPCPGLLRPGARARSGRAVGGRKGAGHAAQCTAFDWGGLTALSIASNCRELGASAVCALRTTCEWLRAEDSG